MTRKTIRSRFTHVNLEVGEPPFPRNPPSRESASNSTATHRAVGMAVWTGIAIFRSVSRFAFASRENVIYLLLVKGSESDRATPNPVQVLVVNRVANSARESLVWPIARIVSPLWLIDSEKFRIFHFFRNAFATHNSMGVAELVVFSGSACNRGVTVNGIFPSSKWKRTRNQNYYLALISLLTVFVNIPLEHV